MLAIVRENTYSSTPRAPKRLTGAASACLIGLAAASFCWSAARAAPSPVWAAAPYHYVVVDQDVRGVLTEFGRNVGVPVVLTDKVRGRARGEIKAATAGEFLRKICEAQDLTWYFDGSILHVSADEEFATQVIDVGTVGPQALEKELDRLGVRDERFAVRATGSSTLVGVSGPPAFLAVVRETAERMKPPPRVSGDDPRVRVFRGGAQAEVVRTPPSTDGGQSPNASAKEN
ncbi:type III secretion protein [Chenggangzhangella methanolivorans]|uniref:Type III secretion protein n=1 Tax=Chenggangzhangella methanolivorans TaxID=1437009 RepID=A0A9E6R717_9HYPH|nr:type III secretion protein [Chenggangzhangella methanolivorans]QZN98469.1 type III secretion protein [Chenggangzhangella methanolivorans]